MTYQTFKQQIRQSLQDAFGSDVSIILQDILKNNNTHLDGLTVLTPGCNISPTIYLNDYFHAYENGRPISDICTEIRDIYQQNKPAHSVDISFFTCYEKVQSRIIFKLINYERNKALLTDVPHFRFLDLAIVFNCLIGIDPDDISQSFSEEKISCSPSASGSSATILIHNHHLSFWNITKDDLYALACKNTPDLQHYELRNMSDVLKELLSDDDSSAILAPPAPFPMYVLSNHTKLNGSACILYQDLLKNFAEHLRSDLYILPSSIHEVLLPHRPILCYPPQTVPQIPVSSPIGNSRKWFRKSMPHSFPQRIFSPTMYIIIQGKAAVLPCKLFFKKVTVLPCKLCHQTVVQLFIFCHRCVPGEILTHTVFYQYIPVIFMLVKYG